MHKRVSYDVATTKRQRLACILALAAMWLAACGGGGGATSASSAGAAGIAPSPPTTAPAGSSTNANATALVTAVVAVTYEDGSATRAAFDHLASARATCGMGLLAQHPRLDQAAGAHAAYIASRFGAGEVDLVGHDEDPTRSGYTGATPQARATAAGYAGAVGEAIAFAVPLSTAPTAPRGADLMSRLLAAPYHARLLLDGAREVGLAISASPKAAPFTGYVDETLVVETGYPVGTLPQAPAGLVSFPCEGSTGVLPAFTGERPDPLAGTGWTTAGTPIYVKGAGKLAITSWTLREVVSGASANSDGLVLTSSTDPNRILNDREAVIFPRAALKSGMSYEFNFTGTDGGAPMSRQFVFLTQ